MIKHIYKVSGINSFGENFVGSCVDDDIIHAIQMCRNKKYSVHSISRCEQVQADSEIKIIEVLTLV